MEPSEELALIFECIREGLGGTVLWRVKAASRVRADRDLQGLTPEGIRRDLIEHVRSIGLGAVSQRHEIREGYSDDHEFWYRVLIPYDFLPQGLFVELVLVDLDDPEYPTIEIVNAHRQ